MRIIRIQLNLDKKCFLVTLVLRRMQYNFSIIVCNCLKQVYERVLIGGLMHALNQGHFWYTCNFLHSENYLLKIYSNFNSYFLSWFNYRGFAIYEWWIIKLSIIYMFFTSFDYLYKPIVIVKTPATELRTINLQNLSEP